VSVEEHKAIVRRYYDDLWNRRDTALADELIATDFAFRGSLGTETRGRDGFLRYVATVRAAFPDFDNTVEELIAEGDKVVARLTYRGTHRGELFGVEPTGTAIAFAGVAIFTVRDGRLATGWVLGDTLGLLRQLGAAPERP
jgi:steroid delta-isomerase-like uncharacterized protein